MLIAQLLAAPGGGSSVSPPAAALSSAGTVRPRLSFRLGIDPNAASVPADTGRRRRRATAIEYSGFYRTRVALHKTLSFAMLPLFAGSFVTGDQILKKSTDAPKWARNLHRPLATATAVVFSANTITGLWNLWDSRKDPAGRAKRYIHSLLFVAAGAGFTWAGVQLADDAEGSQAMREKHRNVALVSMGLSVTSWAMMLLFK
ncbi:MAG: hypothetical protein HOP28_02460 [Gemmatimonadales bacterium]|nr:hypothetical protein [Gemmatimonadales bacterium]